MSLNRRLDADAVGEEGETLSREELLVQLELFAEENQQLRESYTQAKQTKYRQTAIGLGVVGVLAIGGGVLVQSANTVLFVLGGIGLFGAILTYYLTPEQFVSADVGRDVYATLAGNETALTEELGLAAQHRYVPLTTDGGVRLFIPQDEAAPLPDEAMLTQTVVAPDDGERRGLALDPSGQRLFRSFEDALAGSLSSTPAELTEQLTDAIIEQFELARAASADVAADEGRVTVEISGSVYGPLDRFDHPIASFLAVGLAQGLDEPIAVEITEDSDGDRSSLVTCRWDTGEAPVDD